MYFECCPWDTSKSTLAACDPWPLLSMTKPSGKGLYCICTALTLPQPLPFLSFIYLANGALSELPILVEFTQSTSEYSISNVSVYEYVLNLLRVCVVAVGRIGVCVRARDLGLTTPGLEFKPSTDRKNFLSLNIFPHQSTQL